MIKNTTEILILIGIFVLAVLGVRYEGSRMAYVFGTESKDWYRCLAVFVIIGFVSVGAGSYSWTDNRFMNYVIVFGGFMTVFLLYLTAATVVVELVGLLVKMSRAVFGGIVFGAALGLTIYSILNAFT